MEKRWSDLGLQAPLPASTCSWTSGNGLGCSVKELLYSEGSKRFEVGRRSKQTECPRWAEAQDGSLWLGLGDSAQVSPSPAGWQRG